MNIRTRTDESWPSIYKRRELWVILLIAVFGGIGALNFGYGPVNVTRVLTVAFILLSINKLLDIKDLSQVVLLCFGVEWTVFTLMQGDEPVSNFNIYLVLGYTVYAYLISQWSWSDSDVYRLSHATVISGVIVAFSCIYEHRTGTQLIAPNTETVDIIMQDVRRVRGLLGDPNASGGVVSAAIVVLLVRWGCFGKPKYYVLTLALLVFLFLGLYPTASRTAFAALVAGLGVFFFRRGKIDSKKLGYGIVLTLVLLVGSSYLLQGRQFSFSADVSSRSRIELINYGWLLLSQSPLVGHGAFVKIGSHNNFVQVAVSSGLIGLVTYVSFHVAGVRNLVKHRKNSYVVLLGCQYVTFTVVGLGVAWINSVLYWTIIGLCLGISRRYLAPEASAVQTQQAARR